ncbi:MAG: tRNA (N(6)-L-threonylcarbamoyladenosine(37)-C(2))-methylthiotransferase [Methanobacteriaceae archaeon]|nr:tRNA (N(6)-L-threonylcarbamoyladenosine(37)-C(2))-methylthiotransferase [Methanobacteriaceae archaeon]
MKVYIETFGCTFNQGDSQIMAGLLEENHAKLVPEVEDADVIIVNTCYVKHPTEQKMLNRIHKLQKNFPDKKLLVAGCMVEIDQEKLKKIAPEAGWIGPHRIKSVTNTVKSIYQGKKPRLTGFRDDIKVGLPKIRYNPFINIIQICEGCMGECTYCCTRFARGRLQSYPSEDIISEATAAVNDGCIELQLTAQDTAAYGNDTGETLYGLMENINQINGEFRVRIGMMHPKNMLNNIENIIRAFKGSKIYKFLHIPIQSGNNQVLRDMGRGHSVEDFKYIISRFKEEIPEISIATDVIVGYPTEDEDKFMDTYRLLDEIKPDFIHISKYRHRPQAISSQMDELEYSIVKKRSKLLDELKSKITYKRNQELLNSIQRILITGKGPKGGYTGFTDSYKMVIVDKAEPGTFQDVKVVEALSTYLRGKILN